MLLAKLINLQYSASMWDVFFFYTSFEASVSNVTSLIEGTMNANNAKQSMIPSLRRLGRRAVFHHDNDPKHTVRMTTALLKKLRVKVICGASSNGRWRSAKSLTSTSSVMSSWRSWRGLQWQPVKLRWTSCPRGLRQCWKIMAATQNIDTLGPIWTFSLKVYSLLWTAVQTLMAVCWVILRDSKFTLLYKLYT